MMPEQDERAALTGGVERLQWAAPDEGQVNQSPQDERDIENFLDTLAQVALSVASRRRPPEGPGVAE